MIDVENLVFTTIRNKLKTEYTNIQVTGEYVEVPASFPSVSIEQSDNAVYKNTQDAQGVEHHASLMYSVNVYSNKQSGKKSEAKGIMSVVDTAFKSIGFTRTMSNPIPNKDSSIYRITARYEAIVDEGMLSSSGSAITTTYRVYGK